MPHSWTMVAYFTREAFHLQLISRYMNRISMTMTTSFSCISQSEIKTKKSNKNAGERELADPLRNNNEFDTDEDDNMIVDFTAMFPSEVYETATT
jgi:hypothetical protein